MISNPIKNLREALACLTLALRDGTRLRIALVSVLIWLGAIFSWAAVLYFARPSLPQLSIYAKVIAVSLIYLLLVVVTVRIAIELLLMKQIQKICLAHYPMLSRNQKNSLGSAVRDFAKPWALFLVGAVVCFFIPLIGAVLLFLLGSYVNVRTLVGDALSEVASDSERREVIQSNRLTMTFLGLMTSGLMLIPFVNFFAPSILGASVCHLGMRNVLRKRRGLSKESPFTI